MKTKYKLIIFYRNHKNIIIRRKKLVSEDGNNYEPNPIDTSHINLPHDLLELTEFLATNVHESWSKQKKIDGWVFAKVLDAENKKTPYLVPYEQLPEHIREYDRISAIQTLKLILALGYKILNSKTSEKD